MTNNFKPIKIEELSKILSLTIKEDEENKIATFLCQLSSFTEDAQFNISFNAPSSSGKSYIPLEISYLFPKEDVMKLGNVSPTAFYHEQGTYNKEKNQMLIDLSRKIIIFMDMPNPMLLERMRSLLSHDEKEVESKTTDKSEKGGHRTKTVIIRGFPSVIFCSAGLKMDEQESTRFLLLSPESTSEKIKMGIEQAINKGVNPEEYFKKLDADPDRQLLKERILAIKNENIGNIRICNPKIVSELFSQGKNLFKPRHQRDIKRFMAIIKSLALLNLWWRERDGSTLIANEEDIQEAYKIWQRISISQEFNLTPYVHQIYTEIIQPLWKEKKTEDKFNVSDGRYGVTRQEILQKYYNKHGRVLDTHQLRQQILPTLETAGLITQEADLSDRRKILVYPAVLTDIEQEEINSERQRGVIEEELSEIW